MGNGTDKSGAIDRLLEERVKILNWLDRLQMATADTPESVRHKVKLDYERRLADVGAELNGFTEELHSALAGHQKRHAEHLGAEAAAETRLAEAKLRHAVGEFPEAQWNGLHSEILGVLVGVRDGLKSSADEIRRLEEVLSTIKAKPAVPPAPTYSAPAPAPTPRPPMPTAATQPPAVDELAFLKSVTEDDRPGPRPAPAPAVQPAPQPQAVDSGGAGPKKTLKCGECGVMNFPTEWYCERCGAELAAL